MRYADRQLEQHAIRPTRMIILYRCYSVIETSGFGWTIFNQPNNSSLLFDTLYSIVGLMFVGLMRAFEKAMYGEV